MRTSCVLLRRGKPRPTAKMFPDKYRRVPSALKPMQGGQQFFNDFMLRTADEDIAQRSNPNTITAAVANSTGDASLGASASIPLRLPQADFSATRDALDQSLREELRDMQELAAGEETRRSFNELEWYEVEAKAKLSGAAAVPSDAVTQQVEPDGTLLPDRVADNDYFKSRFGYSLIKESELKTDVEYKELDLWGEMPKYTRDMYFLYVISRRRNTYAVCFGYNGKRLLKPYTVGNRGLKGGDKGFRGEGSTDSGHQVMSMYINDVMPIIREQCAASGRPIGKGDKVDVVVRVMGFYNGRQGAVRAVTDRSDLLRVRYFEDITPFPLNGPKMPRGVFK